MVALNDLRDLYVDQLKDLYNAEAQLVKALPKMAKAAHDEKLKKAFQDHLIQTQNQINRLEQIFTDLGMKAKGKTCLAMKGLIEEGKEALSLDADPSVYDAGLIAAAQRVEHYEIAGYGTVRTFAQMLGEKRQAQLLQQTLDEEGQTDKLLTNLAESTINAQAAS